MSIDINAIKQAQATDPVNGLLNLRKQTGLIENYSAHCLGAGVEAFEGAAGQLTLIGIKTQFGDHALELGAGNEGLGEFITKLKKGIEGLKKSIKNGDKPKADDAAIKSAIKEVNNTYAKNGFFGGKMLGGFKTSSVGVIQNYVGEGTPDEILAAIQAIIPAAVKECESYLKQTQDYWAKASKFIEELKKVDKDDVDAVKKILARVKSELGDPHKAIEVYPDKPWSAPTKFKSGDKLPVLNTAQAELAGEIMKELLTGMEKVSGIHGDLMKVGNYFEVYTAFKWMTDGPKFDLRDLLFSCLDWDGYTLPGNSGCALQQEYLTDVADYLDKWITDSLK